MAVKIRLSRAGKKKAPFHRLIVCDARNKRDGEFLDDLGVYNGLKGQLVTFNEDRYLEWVKKGAQPTDSAKKIYKMFKRDGLGVAVATNKKVVQKIAAQESAVESVAIQTEE